MKNTVKRITSLFLALALGLGVLGIISVSAAGTTVLKKPVLWSKSGAGAYNFQINTSKAYFQYELPSIPTGAEITSATFYMKDDGFGGSQQYYVSGASFTFYKMNAQQQLGTGYKSEDYSSYVSQSAMLTAANNKNFEGALDGLASDFYVEIDFTEIIKAAYAAGETYFGYGVTLSGGSYTVAKSISGNNQIPMLQITYGIPPQLTLPSVSPVIEGNPVTVSATVTPGGSAVSSVDLTIEEVGGGEITGLPAPVISGTSYAWTLNTLTSGSYTATVTVTDADGFIVEKSVGIRILGSETFLPVPVNTPSETASTHNGKLYDTTQGLKANDSSMISYFEYDLSANGIYNVNSAVWNLTNAFAGSFDLYDVKSAWDKESIKNGVAPTIDGTAFATGVCSSDIDITSYVNDKLAKGETKISFALKTQSGEITIGATDAMLTLEQSDNKRPEILVDTNTSFVSGGVITAEVTDDDIVTSVTAKLDGVACTVSNVSGDEYSITLPTGLSNGVHKLVVTALDYSSAETTVERVVNIGTAYGAHGITSSGATATATVENATAGTVLMIAAYRNGVLEGITVESDIVGGNLTATVDVSAGGTVGVTYKSFICTYDGGFKVLDIK